MTRPDASEEAAPGPLRNRTDSAPSARPRCNTRRVSHKADAERAVTDAALERVILRLGGGRSAGRPGDPASATGWFATGWMGTARSQDVLAFQQHSLPALFDEIRAAVGWRRWLLWFIGPVVRAGMRSRSPYRDQPGTFADPWGAVARKWGDPTPDDDRRTDDDDSNGKRS